MAPNSNKFIQGFTLLEIIATLAVISILAVVVVSRYTASGTNLPARIAVMKSHLRYAQSRSMNTGTVWGIQIAVDGKAYKLFNNKDSGDRLLPGEDPGPIDMNVYGLSITTGTGDLFVSFDTWGRPCPDAACQTLYEANQTVTLTDMSGNSSDITITRNTGFIP